jgi:transcriptional regulator with XRE-family HTH domain
MSKIRNLLAKNLKENRTRLGLTQAELAEIADISTNFLAMIELKQKFPSPEILDRLAAALEIEPSLLFTSPESPEDALLQLQQQILGNIDDARRDSAY